MNQETTLYQDNRITQARYEFTVIEKRIIYLIINEIRTKMIGADKDLFGDLVLNLRHDQLASASDNYNQVQKSIKKLITKFYEFDDENEWMVVSIINKAKHRKKESVWQITVDSDMVAKFVELAKNYTAYNLTIAMSLRSEYSQRFYEYCCQYKNAGGLRLPIKDLRYKLKLEKKYARYASLKLKVIDVAQKELKSMYDKNQCDVYFEYTEVKVGRSVDSLSIKIISNNAAEAKMSIDDIMYFLRNEFESMYDTKNKPANKKFVSKVMGELIMDPEKMKHCYQKLMYVKANIPREERAKYMRFIIKEEYLNS